MNYKEFIERIKTEILNNLPEVYNIAEIEVKQIRKINEILDGFVIVLPKEKNYASPIIYLNQLYRDYTDTGNFELVLNKACDTIVAALEDCSSDYKRIGHNILDFEFAKEHIIYQLINTEMNTELLKTLPHISICDLSLICRIMLNHSDNSFSGILVDNNILKHFEISRDELFEIAKQNTLRLLPPKCRSIEDVLSELLSKADNDKTDISGSLSSRNYSDAFMYVLSNTQGLYGASSMLCSEILDSLAKKANSNLYILPSSIHEVIAVPEAAESLAHLYESVQTINSAHVPPEEKLSDSVYLYDRHTKAITIAAPA